MDLDDIVFQIMLCRLYQTNIQGFVSLGLVSKKWLKISRSDIFWLALIKAYYNTNSLPTSCKSYYEGFLYLDKHHQRLKSECAFQVCNSYSRDEFDNFNPTNTGYMRNGDVLINKYRAELMSSTFVFDNDKYHRVISYSSFYMWVIDGKPVGIPITVHESDGFRFPHYFPAYWRHQFGIVKLVFDSTPFIDEMMSNLEPLLFEDRNCLFSAEDCKKTKFVHNNIVYIVYVMVFASDRNIKSCLISGSWLYIPGKEIGTYTRRYGYDEYRTLVVISD